MQRVPFAECSRDGREFLKLLLAEPRHVGWNRSRRRDAGQLGCVVQHARGTPRISQILERHELGAQLFRTSPVRANARIEQLLHARDAMQPEPVVKPGNPKSRM